MKEIKVIELMDEEIKRGEASLDVAMKVYGALIEIGEATLAKEFSDDYTDYYNGDIETPDEEIIKKVKKALT